MFIVNDVNSDYHPGCSIPQVYLKSAFDVLQHSQRGLSPEDITGLWVASDDGTVLEEMHILAPQYFPNITLESIIRVSGRTATILEASQEYVATT